MIPFEVLGAFSPPRGIDDLVRIQTILALLVRSLEASGLENALAGYAQLPELLTHIRNSEPGIPNEQVRRIRDTAKRARVILQGMASAMREIEKALPTQKKLRAAPPVRRSASAPDQSFP